MFDISLPIVVLCGPHFTLNAPDGRANEILVKRFEKIRFRTFLCEAPENLIKHKAASTTVLA